MIFKSVSEIGQRHRVSVLGVFAPEKFERDVGNVLESEDFEETGLSTTQQDSSLLESTGAT